MNRNRPLLLILLALLLLFTQQSLIAHTVSHCAETRHSQQKEHLPLEQSCDQCHAYATVGSALTGHYALPAVHVPASQPANDHLVLCDLPDGFTHFDSRAPPLH